MERSGDLESQLYTTHSRQVTDVVLIPKVTTRFTSIPLVQSFFSVMRVEVKGRCMKPQRIAY